MLALKGNNLNTALIKCSDASAFAKSATMIISDCKITQLNYTRKVKMNHDYTTLFGLRLHTLLFGGVIF